jgi:hypothetical protein
MTLRLRWALMPVLVVAALGGAPAPVRAQAAQAPAADAQAPNPRGQADLRIWSLIDTVYSGAPGPETPENFDALVELTRRMGFSVADEHLVVVQPPLAEPRLGLKISLNELRVYLQMARAGHRVPLSGVFDPIEYNLARVGLKVDLRRPAMKRLDALLESPDESLRTMATVVVGLGLRRGVDIFADTGDPMLDPLQFLFLVRDLSEEICQPLRRAIRSAPRAVPAPRVVPAALIVRRGSGQWSTMQPYGPLLTGWSEDGVNVGAGLAIGGILTYVDESVAANGGSAAWETFGGVTSVLGAVLSIVKFVGAYACIKTEWTVENPPLVRTKSTHDDGETEVVKCRFRWDVPALMDALKRWRTELNLVSSFQADFDMPKSDVLANTTVKWTLTEGEVEADQTTRDPERWSVRFGSGMNQLNQPIGPDGVSSITLVGLHQRQAIDEKTAEPFMRKVMLTVYPALKSLDDTAQNTVDSAASLGTAALVATGAAPIGLINVAFETVFRSHWVPVASKVIKVRDWAVPGSFTAALSVDLIGGGTVVTTDKPDTRETTRWYIHHHLDSLNLQLRSAGTERGQAERTYRSAEDDYVHFVNDNERNDSWWRDCATERNRSKATLEWDKGTHGQWKDFKPAGTARPANAFTDLRPRLTVNPASGAFVAEAVSVPLLVWATVKNSDGQGDKAGWLTIPLAPGEPEPVPGEAEDAPLRVSGVLPERIRKVVADPTRAKEGEEYLFNVERTKIRWREFKTSGGTVRLPLTMKILWKFEYHPPVVQTTK